MSARLTVWGEPGVADLVRRPRRDLPFPLDDERCRLFSRARHALFVGVRELGLGAGDEVLVPAFHHGSEIEALRRAGLHCRFYEVDPGLEPDEGQLDGLCTRATKALLLVHYLGRPQDAGRWRRWCDARGLLLLEDAAQSWLAAHDGRPVGSSGHLSIFCLYKTLPLPDGAALVCDPAPPAPTERAPGVAPWARARAADLLERWSALRRVRRSIGPRDARVVDDFDLGEPQTAPSWLSSRLLPRVFHPDIAARRRENYAWLASQLPAFMAAPFDELASGASPMLLPLHVEEVEQPALLARLRARRVEGIDFWAVPHPELPVEQFPSSAARRRAIIGVPVHQGLSRHELTRIVEAVRG